MRNDREWPELGTPGWEETARHLHLMSQVIGKTRLALAPMTNHWWNTALYVTPRGLTTSGIAYGGRLFDVELDLLEHRTVLRVSDGSSETILTGSGTIAAYYTAYMEALARLGIEVHLYPKAVELPETIDLARDATVRHYDPDWATRFHGGLVHARAALEEFRAGFTGKASPVHFFWGSFDLAASRYSGRYAPLHPGGAPNCPDRVMQEAYSHEVASAGFFPGGIPGCPDAAFYAYAYPEPPGYAAASPKSPFARYDRTLREFILPYEAVRRSPTPEREVRTFLEATYAAAADLGHWDRHTLERRPLATRTSTPATTRISHGSLRM